MLKKILFVLFPLFIGCSSDDNNDTKAPEGDGSYVELFSDGIDRKVTWGNFGAETECGSIFVSGGSLDPDNRYDFSFQLTDTGHIVRIYYTEKEGDIFRQYSCVDFQPDETFTISNFSYDAVSGEIDFDFEGTLYEQKEGYNADELMPKHLEGTVHHKNTTADECSFFPPRAYMDGSDIYFNDWRKTSSVFGIENKFRSTNGYRLHIWSDKELSEFAPGSYDFTPESDLHIRLYKYIGPMRNTIAESIITEEWETYDCEGRITIEGHYDVPFSHTKASFVFSAFDENGNPVLEMAEGTFETF